jgi:hypothetical protein
MEKGAIAKLPLVALIDPHIGGLSLNPTFTFGFLLQGLAEAANRGIRPTLAYVFEPNS